jgi:hypothetical protein
VVQRWGGLGGSRRCFTYNDHGDIVQETIEQDHGFLRDDQEESSRAWRQRFSFQYDGENWIERTTETIPGKGDGSVDARISVIERRELTYY